MPTGRKSIKAILCASKAHGEVRDSERLHDATRFCIAFAWCRVQANSLVTAATALIHTIVPCLTQKWQNSNFFGQLPASDTPTPATDVQVTGDGLSISKCNLHYEQVVTLWADKYKLRFCAL